MKKLLCLIALIGLLNGCSQTPSSRYKMAQDTAPQRLPTAAELADPIPRNEPFSRQGNRAYSLFGKQYNIVENVQGYSEQGIASWYGQKFHGHLTSNGEYFDMFNMTAAHKSLPLPIYVKVTNLDNGREAIVRVNDRGPFHPGRIIDLSYAAAYKLGVTATGTANVRIDVVTPPLKDLGQTVTTTPQVSESATTKATAQLFVQVAATANRDNAVQLSSRLHDIYALTATLVEREGLHRILVGPFTELEAARWLDTLQENGYQGVFRVQEVIPITTNRLTSGSESTEVH
ncbi:septal ring lytic transglycosylase RlpA family protein [Aliidiomarina quisquiliarum]|uniref:septal ring lytic transglycosylase RlpA family protein n=1 Tax=Aliidiomarina quisquiliarum TaxID=2938947 RepID=UPI00208EF1D9|nr:septal ring lytic transglycosylase RlpA family protein [Aliidiomarina quisquiliarum]MCO4321810.1 septal ring lytic transglycosylase RlpA family protein [Aliidiomarina quisquiliarum]